MARVVNERGAMACESCKRKRGLDDETQQFLQEIILRFDQPTSPIVIKTSDTDYWTGLPLSFAQMLAVKIDPFNDTSPQPSGAGADDVNSRADQEAKSWPPN
jgi:hypothetical protein